MAVIHNTTLLKPLQHRGCSSKERQRAGRSECTGCKSILSGPIAAYAYTHKCLSLVHIPNPLLLLQAVDHDTLYNKREQASYLLFMAV